MKQFCYVILNNAGHSWSMVRNTDAIAPAEHYLPVHHPFWRNLTMVASMRTRVLCACAALLCALPARADDSLNTLTEQEKSGGWKLLFDGKTAEGWRAYKGKGMPDKWHVEDGALILKPRSGKRGGDIVTTDQYDNFELAFEWKISPGGNSGVMYRVSEDEDAPFYTGVEYQILDNAKHPDGKHPKTSAASAYALYAPAKDATMPVGEWNKSKIIVDGNHVEHWLNGEKVVEFDYGSDDWNNRVEASKFKDMKRFGKEAKGHIDLQDHGNEVAYRNIKIRPLKKE